MANENEKKTQKGASVVPQEYIDRMKEFDIEAWRKQKIADAVKYQLEREDGADIPSWWEGGTETYNDRYNSKKYGPWWNCIATATDAYDNRDGCYAIGNKSFLDPKSSTYYEKLGFRLLDDSEESEIGDLYQLGHDSNRPFHMVTLTGKDANGDNIYSWGTGTQRGINRGHYDWEGLGHHATRFRYIGRPELIKEIEAHNAKVRDFQEKTAPLREERKVTLINAPLDKELDMQRTKRNTAEWLAGFVKNKKK